MRITTATPGMSALVRRRNELMSKLANKLGTMTSSAVYRERHSLALTWFRWCEAVQRNYCMRHLVTYTRRIRSIRLMR